MLYRVIFKPSVCEDPRELKRAVERAEAESFAPLEDQPLLKRFGILAGHCDESTAGRLEALPDVEAVEAEGKKFTR